MTSHRMVSTTIERMRCSVPFLVLMLALFSQSAFAQNYVYFPTANTADGKMLSIAGTGLRTVEDDAIIISLAAPSTATSLVVGIFDGETGGMWDQGNSPLQYRIYADPLGDLTGDTQIGGTYVGSQMSDNAWYNITIPTSAAARTGAGQPYRYYMEVTAANPQESYLWSNFKIRATGSISLSTSGFAFTGSLLDLSNEATRNTVYPSYPSLTPTTYDGNWTFYLYVPEATDELVIWDGDLDYGAIDCSTRDTDDPDTPNDDAPDWAASSTRTEGIAVGYPCTGGTTTGYGSGDPPDNGYFAQFRRDPDIRYTVQLPNNGPIFSNNDPSGNLEWEQFRISTDAFNRNEMDYHATALPAGVYTVRISGMDLGNLNAYRTGFPIIGCDSNGNCVPPPPPPPPPSICVHESTYWKKNQLKWPLKYITAGNKTYSKSQAAYLLGKTGCTDISTTLVKQLITAKLNIANGSNSSCISATINAADNWLRTYYVGCRVSCYSSSYRTGKDLAAELYSYNIGEECVEACDDSKPMCKYDYNDGKDCGYDFGSRCRRRKAPSGCSWGSGYGWH